VRSSIWQLAFRRLKHGAPAKKEVISVLGTPSMTARRQPQAHPACQRGEKGQAQFAMSTVTVLRSTASSTDKGRGYLHWWLGVGCNPPSGYALPSVTVSQLPQGLLDLAHRLRAVAGSAESPPGWG